MLVIGRYVLLRLRSGRDQLCLAFGFRLGDVADAVNEVEVVTAAVNLVGSDTVNLNLSSMKLLWMRLATADWGLSLLSLYLSI